MSARTLTTFAHLVGLGSVQRWLQERTVKGCLSPSLLFVGPEGVGKRSLARAWIAWYCCRTRATSNDACGQCPSCVQLAAESYPDLLWVRASTGKREIGIDRAREVKRFLSIQPMAGPSRIAVIESAEQLTTAAQNALLKILEEPPPNTWLLATTSTPDAVLPTVRSRCQRVAVPPLPEKLLRQALLQHGLAAPEAENLLNFAEGSVGKALAIHATLGAKGIQEVSEFLAAIDHARYGALTRYADQLAKDDRRLDAQLHAMLLALRKQVIEFAGQDRQQARVALERAEVITRTWRTMREGYPNRTLLLETMLLQLTQAKP